MPRERAARFGIGEWYGYSFVRLTPARRREFAALAPNQTKHNAPACPFLSDGEITVRCWKSGGICSLRLYRDVGDGSAVPVEGEKGSLRVVCPSRFRQSGTIYSKIGEAVLDTPTPRVIKEVQFLRRNKILPDEDEEGGNERERDAEDVGKIDNVLVHPDTNLLRWCALEIQAVYFSGRKMGSLFAHIGQYQGSGIPFPDLSRRPDYRSSGPKRLMPQLQIKVPTLRRWGKKMAVVVDMLWFQTNLVDVETVSDVSNCDIAWFLVGFDESTDPATLTIGEPQLQTLERAVEGLTGGYPVTLSEFETKIREKLNPRPVRRRRSSRATNRDSAQ